jgi:hypothetical protein
MTRFLEPGQFLLAYEASRFYENIDALGRTLSAGFLIDRRRDIGTRYETVADALAAGSVTFDVLESASSLRTDRTGSFYVRYKRLLGALEIEPPPFFD